VPTDALLDFLNGTIVILKEFQAQRNPQVRVIWKTSPPGHPNCWIYKEPVNNITTMVDLVNDRSLYTFHSAAKGFHWWDFAQQNEKVIDFFAAQSQGLQFEIFDGYDLLLGRPDMHRAKVRKRYDCLHHCHPGPHDIFSRLLAHYLHMTPEQVMAPLS